MPPEKTQPRFATGKKRFGTIYAMGNLPIAPKRFSATPRAALYIN
jgi:hypothetical protein